MKLFYRTIAIVVFLVGIMLFATLYFSSNFLAKNYATAEDRIKTDQLLLAHEELTASEGVLASIAADWATWDAAYNYVISKNPDFERINLNFESYKAVGINLVMIYDNNGSIIYQGIYDTSENSSGIKTVPDLSGIGRLDLLVLENGQTNHSKGHGLISIGGRYYIIAARPILKSDGTGPSAGTLIIGRYFREEDMGQIRHVPGNNVSYYPLSGAALPDDFKAAAQWMDTTGNMEYVPEQTSETILTGYTIEKDIYGNNAIIIRIDSPRQMYAQFRESQAYLIFSQIMTGLVLMAATVLILDRLVLARIARLSEFAKHSTIAGTAGTLAPEKGDGEDEIGSLDTSVMRMMESQVQAAQEISKEREKYLMLIDQLPNPVVVYYKRKIIFANMAVAALGYSPE
ncbi:MAG TPA: CHASE4 domain-containing protein, partial [Candidatus Micrarchaeota archaeon]|nr:CHASE4 domain-containing protein [Candidatus Micrarchaeota archaeon]